MLINNINEQKLSSSSIFCTFHIVLFFYQILSIKKIESGNLLMKIHRAKRISTVTISEEMQSKLLIMIRWLHDMNMFCSVLFSALYRIFMMHLLLLFNFKQKQFKLIRCLVDLNSSSRCTLSVGIIGAH